MFSLCSPSSSSISQNYIPYSVVHGEFSCPVPSVSLLSSTVWHIFSWTKHHRLPVPQIQHVYNYTHSKNSLALHPTQTSSSSHITLISMYFKRKSWALSKLFLSFAQKVQSLNSVISSDVAYLLRSFPLHLSSALIFSHLEYWQSLQASLIVLGFSHFNTSSTHWLLEWSS